MIKKLFLFFLKIYQTLLSPFLGKNCRFVPRCSVYFHQAVEHYGILKGSFLGGKRILRCHPFHRGGWDPLEKNLKLKI